MPSNEPFLTIVIGLFVLVLAKLLVHGQLIPSSIFTLATDEGSTGKQRSRLLVGVSVGATLLAFIIVMWDLLM